jgi:hypothetical protein
MTPTDSPSTSQVRTYTCAVVSNRFTEVMAEERGLKVDFVGYEAAKQLAREASSGTETRKEEVTLSVHQISNLSERGTPATDDSAKFDYKVLEDGTYSFSDIKAKVVAILSGGAFVDTITANDKTQVCYFFALMVSNYFRSALCLTAPTSTRRWVAKCQTLV